MYNVRHQEPPRTLLSSPQLSWATSFTSERNSRYGDYTAPRNGQNHLITVNHNLNKYAFLITLVHEVAHLVTYNNHRHRVSPHGGEWKPSSTRSGAMPCASNFSTKASRIPSSK